jgi:hypothetical protein
MSHILTRPEQLSRYSDSLRAGRSWDRIPVGARFSAPVQTGPGAHPASCTMGTGYFPGVKRPGRGADQPPPSLCRGHERVELYLFSPSGSSWPTFYLPFLQNRFNIRLRSSYTLENGDPRNRFQNYSFPSKYTDPKIN